MPKHAAYAPRHRAVAQTPLRDAAQAPARALKKTLVATTVAAAGTGAVVAGGVVLNSASSSQSDVVPAAVAAPDAAVRKSLTTQRESTLSRGEARTSVDQSKVASLGSISGADTTSSTKTVDLASGDPRSIAAALLADFGWSGDQFGCLDSLWTRESNWRINAANPSGAYGIPQALPGSKMSSAGSDWRTNPATQIKWGLGYIRDRYGSPCGAWGHSEGHGWY